MLWWGWRDELVGMGMAFPSAELYSFVLPVSFGRSHRKKSGRPVTSTAVLAAAGVWFPAVESCLSEIDGDIGVCILAAASQSPWGVG